MRCSRQPQIRSSRRQSSKMLQGGTTYLELLLVIPLMLLLIAGVIDLGRLLIEYAKISQVAYEGARVASKTLDLEIKTAGIGEVCSTNGVASCCSDNTYCPGNKQNLTVAVDRVYQLLQYSQIRVATVVAPYTLRVRYDKGADRVEVYASAKISLLTSIFSESFTVSATSSSPYLY